MEHDVSILSVAFWQDPIWGEIAPLVLLSLKVALWGTLGALPLAAFVAYLLARRRFFGWGALNALVHFPLLLPPVVTGYGLLLLFGRNGAFGPVLQDVFNVSFSFNWKGAALAAAVMGFPLMVRALRQGFEHIDLGLYEAARMLGASAWRLHFTLTVPLLIPSVLSAFILGFAKSLGEFGATVTFVAAIPGETQTLSSAIYALLQIPGQDRLLAILITFSIGLCVVALAMSEYLSRRALRDR